MMVTAMVAMANNACTKINCYCVRVCIINMTQYSTKEHTINTKMEINWGEREREKKFEIPK